MRTLMLDLDTWDLCLDRAGQIVVTSGAYGTAQSVANACRLFTNDAWYNPEDGIPHFAIDLGKKSALSVVRSRMRQQALTVPEVTEADVQIESITDRELTGNIQLTLNDGTTASVTV